MANLADAIRGFYGSGLSHHEFFVRIDRALEHEHASTAHLLDILGDENARVPLPPDVYEELKRRIERRAEATQGLGAEDTRVETRPGDSRWTQPSGQTSGTGERFPADGLERMKGVGDTLNGRFVLEECIGFGGMGTVYKALDLRKLEASDRKPYIAIKVLNVQFRGHPKSLIALQREARKAQTLAHPNIVTVYDFDRDGAMVYLTMEYLLGKPLSQIVRAPGFSGLPLAQVQHIVTGICRALAYAHERGFVHCDLKPANVFLLDNGEVKVIDFGIARVFHKTEEDSEATVFDPGSLGGLTPAYASPEMIEHLDPDPRDDIYALACITYELLTGKHPFNRLSATQARSAGMRPERPAKLGTRQWRALKAALAFDRASRTPTVMAFLHEFSGETNKPVLVAVAASGLTLLVLSVVGLTFYLASRTDTGMSSGSSGGTQSAQSSPAAPAAQDIERPSATTSTVPPRAGSSSASSTSASTTQTLATQAPTTQAHTTQVPAPALSMATVAPMLARVPCSALAASVHGDEVHVRGYLGRRVGVASLKETLSAIPGTTLVDIDAQPVADADCQVVEIFAPYWKRNQETGHAALIRTRARNNALMEGNPLVVDIRTPAYASYAYVDYFVLDGSVAHLVPNQRSRANQAPANYEAAIGSLGNWVISAPFGSEMIVLLLTPAPLFEPVRPEVESRAEYLQLLRRQLAQMAAKQGGDRIVADFVQITTRPRKR